MTISQLKPHICIGFHHLPKGSYLKLDIPYEIDKVDAREVFLHEISTGKSIIQSKVHIRESRFHLS